MTQSHEELATKLTPTHLQQPPQQAPSLQELAEASQTEQTPDVDSAKANDRLLRMRQKEYTFPFKTTSVDGTVYSGIFTNRALDIGDRIRVAALEARLLEGVAYAAVDPIMGDLTKAVAHMYYSIKSCVQESPQGWNADFLRVFDGNVVLALFEEVLAHQRTFLGLVEDPQGSQEKA